MSDTSYSDVKYIVSNPSKTGPNLSMNTQDTQNGDIGVNSVQPNLQEGMILIGAKSNGMRARRLTRLRAR